MKILLVVSMVLIAGLSIYVLLAVETFKKDKVELIYDLNRSSSLDISSEITSSLQAASNDFKLFVEAYGHLGADNTAKTFRTVLEEDPLLVDVAIYRTGPEDGRLSTTHMTQSRFLLQSQIPQDFFITDLPSHRPIPYDQISRDSLAIWNATIPKGPPLIGIGMKVILTNSKGTDQLFVAGYLRADGFLKSLSQGSITKAFIVDRNGRVLVHPDASLMNSAADMSKHPLVKQALGKQARQAVVKFRDGDEDYIGAYTNIGIGGLNVITQTEYYQAFAAIGRLVKRSLIFALAIVAFSFLVTMIFSQTLTKPITELMNVMKKVSAGDLTVELESSTEDEIGILTEAFNHMVGDLKESRNQLLELNKNLEKKVKERTKQLEEMAIRDPLTGMFNRRYFNEKLKEEIVRYSRTGKPVSIVYLDIDHFKKYNDGNGHPQGDTLLKMFSRILQQTVRKTDICARLGGEEFCVILPETPVEGAYQGAEKIRKTVEATNFPHGEKQPLGRVTCSLGVSEYPRFAKNEEDLIKSADSALYVVKEAGRNKVGTPVPQEEVTSPHIATG